MQKKALQAALTIQANNVPATINTSRTPSVVPHNSTPVLPVATAAAPGKPQTVGIVTPVNVYETYIGSFLGKFSTGFSDLDKNSAMFVGLFCAVLYSVCFIVSAYMIHFQIAHLVTGMFGDLTGLFMPGNAKVDAPQSGSVLGAVTARGVYKLFLITCVPFISIALSSALIRKLFSDEEGSFGGDVFVAGIALMPLALVMLITGIVGIANWEVTIVRSVAALCYTIILLYSGCTIIGRIRDTAAAIAVPVMLLLSGWLTKIILTKLFSSGQI